MARLPYDSNPALFGADPKEGIVAVETAGDDRVVLYVRTDRGILREEDGLAPFLLLESEDLLSGWSGSARFEPLEGPWDYRALARFPGWKALQAALRHLASATGRTAVARGGEDVDHCRICGLPY